MLYLFLACQVLGVAVGGLAVLFFNPETSDRSAGLLVHTVVIAIIASQLNLLAISAAFGRGNVLLRWALCLAGIAAIVIPFGILGSAGTERYPVLIGFSLLLPGTMIWALLQVPYWIVRGSCSVHLSKIAPTATPLSMRQFRFGLRHLMGITLIVCLIAGAAPWFIPDDLFAAHRSRDLENVILGFLLFTGVSLVGMTTVLTLLHPRLWRWGFVVSFFSAACLAWGLYYAVDSMESVPDDPLGFVIFVLATYAWTAASLLLLRFSGYRLVASDAALSSAAATS